MSAHIEFDLPDWEAERLAASAQAHGLPLEIEALHLIQRELGPFDFEPGLPDDSSLL
jgi:hypothetical protein